MVRSSPNFQAKYLPDEKISDKTKNFGHHFLYKHPGFLTVSSNFASCLTQLVHTYFFHFVHFLSFLMEDQLRSGMNPGSDQDFPEIHPTLIDYISELKWTFSIIFDFL